MPRKLVLAIAITSLSACSHTLFRSQPNDLNNKLLTTGVVSHQCDDNDPVECTRSQINESTGMELQEVEAQVVDSSHSPILSSHKPNNESKGGICLSKSQKLMKAMPDFNSKWANLKEIEIDQDLFNYLFPTESVLGLAHINAEWFNQEEQVTQPDPVEKQPVTSKKPSKPSRVHSVKIHNKYQRYHKLIQEVAERTQVEPALLHAIIQAESSYNPRARSPRGAVGLMQLMPATARRFGVKNRTDPAANIYGGARYLRYLLKMFNNNKKLAIASYNAGEFAVKRYGNKVPPYKQTQKYVTKVMALYETHRRNNM